jgi:hypothetical protein
MADVVGTRALLARMNRLLPSHRPTWADHQDRGLGHWTHRNPASVTGANASVTTAAVLAAALKPLP